MKIPGNVIEDKMNAMAKKMKEEEESRAEKRRGERTTTAGNRMDSR